LLKGYNIRSGESNENGLDKKNNVILTSDVNGEDLQAADVKNK
jgi:hypothetical protein